MAMFTEGLDPHALRWVREVRIDYGSFFPCDFLIFDGIILLVLMLLVGPYFGDKRASPDGPLRQLPRQWKGAWDTPSGEIPEWSPSAQQHFYVSRYTD